MSELNWSDHAWMSATLTDVSAGTDVDWRAPTACELIRVGIAMTETNGAATAAVTFESQTADATAQDPTGAVHLGTMTIPITQALNTVVWREMSSSITGKPFVLRPGEILHMDCATVAQVGAGYLFVHYRPLPFVDVTLYTANQSTSPGYTDSQTALGISALEVTS